jgi:hypothetical protein
VSIGYWLAGLVVTAVIVMAVVKTNERMDRCEAYGKAYSVTTKFDSRTNYCLAKAGDSWIIVTP